MTEEPPTKKKCLGADCDNEAGSLQCPTCLKLKITDSYFCSQDCFKKNWVCHLWIAERGELRRRVARVGTDPGYVQNSHKAMHKQESSTHGTIFALETETNLT